MDLKIAIPSVKVRGNYDISGQFLIIPFRVRGEFLSEFSNVTAIARILGKQVERNDKVYMDIDRFDIDVVSKSAKFKIIDKVAPRFGKLMTLMRIFLFILDNFIQILAEFFNIFLNQNYELIIQEMRKSVSNSLVKVFKEILQAAFASVPINVYLLD
jgi:hypothetical protein